ncbi:2170_t:CDS:1, partial [Acaulospora morrowiae]
QASMFNARTALNFNWAKLLGGRSNAEFTKSKKNLGTQEHDLFGLLIQISCGEKRRHVPILMVDLNTSVI